MPYVTQSQLAEFIDRRARQLDGGSKRARVDSSMPTHYMAAELASRNRYLTKAANWLGWGDYQISSNSLISGGSGMNSAARLSSTGAREVRLIYREYVGDVKTHPEEAGAFYQQNYAINPGLIDVAPWLSSIVSNYEQWRPNGILFEFVSTSGEITNNQALGKVIMATDYRADTLETKFSNVQEMLAEAYSQEAKPTSNMFHGLECAPSERTRNVYYTRCGGNASGTSLADYDLAQTTIATVGGPGADITLGSLYIHWDITLFKPTMFEGVQNKGAIIRRYRSSNSPAFTAEQWLSDDIEIDFGCQLAGGANSRLLALNDSDLPQDDFFFHQYEPGEVLHYHWPRWAVEGSVWRVFYNINLTAANPGGTDLEITAPLIGFTETDQLEYIAGFRTPNPAIVVAGATAVSLSFYIEAYIRVKKFGPENSPGIKIEGLADVLAAQHESAPNIVAHFGIDSVPNWFGR